MIDIEAHVLCYENVPYTIATVESVLPTLPAERIHVWDNHSSREGVFRLGRRLPPGVVVHLIDRDLGGTREARIGKAKNLQLMTATSRWVLQLDNDVGLDAEWLTRMNDLVEQHPDVRLWALYTAPNHHPTNGDGVRTPDMISGAALLLRLDTVVKYDIRWPEEPQDYSTHPVGDAIQGFTGVDVEFGDRWTRKGLKIAMPPIDLAVHGWQPGRIGGYR
jgi:hypothetical protein